MKNELKSEADRKAEEARESIRAGIARARRIAEESKLLLDRLRYGRLGPRPGARY